jgi:hypothetical protein
MWSWVPALATELVLDEEVRWADEVTVPLGLTTFRLDEGYVFPVHTEAGQPAGFVFVGGGQADFALREPGEALAFAATLGKPAWSVLDSRSWSEDFDVALVLGPDPRSRQPVQSLPVVSEEQDGVLYFAEQDPYGVVVTGYRLGEARRRAQEALRQRVDRLARLGLDPRVALDQHELQPSHPRWLAEVHTDRVWRDFVEPAVQSLQDRWLSFAHDPSGAIDDTYADTVFVHGLQDTSDGDPQPKMRVLTGLPHGVPARGATVTRSAVNVVIEQGPGISHEVELEAELTLTTDVDTRLVNLAVPENRSAPLEGLISTDGAFRIEAVETADGRALVSSGAVFSPHRPRGTFAVDGWILPEVLPAGASMKVRVRWSERWPAAGLMDLPAYVISKLVESGVSFDEGEALCFFGLDRRRQPLAFPEGFRGTFPSQLSLGRVAQASVVPRVLGGSESFPAQIRVGTTLGPGWKAGIGGATRRLEEGGRWWIAETQANAQVSFGQYTEETASAVAGFPEIHLLHHEPMDASPEFIRSVMHFFSGVLPPFPTAEIVVAQGPSLPALDPATLLRFPCTMNPVAAGRLLEHTPVFPTETGRAPLERSQPWVEAAPGQIVISGLRQLGNEVGGLELQVRRRYPHIVERGVVHGVMQQWWGSLGESRRDAWIAEGASAWYRDLFVRAAWPEDAELWEELQAQDLEVVVGQRAQVPLIVPAPWNGEVGARFFRALAARIGEPVLLRALHQFLDGPEHTTEALLARLEQGAGIELDSWFDAWVVAGLRPSVRGEWWMEGGSLRLSLQSDAPGSFELPVVVTTERGTRTSWVTLTDGELQTPLPVKGAPLRVEIDPEGLLPLSRAQLARRNTSPSPSPRVPREHRLASR